jgi:hypothetical protein
VILFPAYIAAIWIPAFVFRRKPLGFLIAIAGPAPIMLLAWVIGAMMPTASLMQTPWWLTLYGAVAGAILLGGVLLACAPRRAKSHECPLCHYDLRGNVTGVCPECGGVFNAALLGEDPSLGVVTSAPAIDPASGGRADPRAA